MPSVWLEWNWEPSILMGLALLAGLYWAATGPWRARFDRAASVMRAQRLWFLSGVGVMFLALVSPLDALSDRYLFSAHMLQHFLIGFVAPPMLLLGTPGWLLRPLVQPLLRSRLSAWALRLLTAPLVAFGAFNLIFIVWHVPAFYEATLHNEALHIFEHLLFIGTGVMNWWPILSPLPELPRLSSPAQVLYLFAEAIPTSVLGAFVTFPATVLYPTYADAPRILNLSPYEDQQFAGLVMWMPGAMIYLLALSLVLRDWFNREQTASAMRQAQER